MIVELCLQSGHFPNCSLYSVFYRLFQLLNFSPGLKHQGYLQPTVGYTVQVIPFCRPTVADWGGGAPLFQKDKSLKSGNFRLGTAVASDYYELAPPIQISWIHHWRYSSFGRLISPHFTSNPYLYPELFHKNT